MALQQFDTVFDLIKGAQSIEMSEGVGNPVYDSFDEGRALEEVRATNHEPSVLSNSLS